jgi:hypothetical protein
MQPKCERDGIAAGILAMGDVLAAGGGHRNHVPRFDGKELKGSGLSEAHSASAALIILEPPLLRWSRLARSGGGETSDYVRATGSSPSRVPSNLSTCIRRQPLMIETALEGATYGGALINSWFRRPTPVQLPRTTRTRLYSALRFDDRQPWRGYCIEAWLAKG